MVVYEVKHEDLYFEPALKLIACIIFWIKAMSKSLLDCEVQKMYQSER